MLQSYRPLDAEQTALVAGKQVGQLSVRDINRSPTIRHLKEVPGKIGFDMRVREKVAGNGKIITFNNNPDEDSCCL